MSFKILLTLEPGLLLSLLLSLLHTALLQMLWGSQDLIKIRWTSVWLVFSLVLAVKIFLQTALYPFHFLLRHLFTCPLSKHTHSHISAQFFPRYNHVRFAWEDHPSNLEQQRCFDTDSPWEQSNKLEEPWRDTVSQAGNLSRRRGRSHRVFYINTNKCFFHGTSPVLSRRQRSVRGTWSWSCRLSSLLPLRLFTRPCKSINERCPRCLWRHLSAISYLKVWFSHIGFGQTKNKP